LAFRKFFLQVLGAFVRGEEAGFRALAGMVGWRRGGTVV
jgi:hypothetical protein